MNHIRIKKIGNMGDDAQYYYKIENRITERVLFLSKKNAYYKFYECAANSNYFDGNYPAKLFRTKQEVLDFLFIYAI
jgi:hypothetical protein